MNTFEKLKQLIRKDQVIPVIGAGASFATAGLPSWRGLVKDGLEYAADKGLDRDNLIATGSTLLAENKLTAAATIVKDLLKAPRHPFSDWLSDLFSKPNIRSKVLIESIQDLSLPIIATTNYDDLLAEVGLNQNPNIYDWSQHEEIQQALYSGKRCILHFHGRYAKPVTTIFGADDYSKLASQKGYKTILQQLWMNKHFLFIGCSKDGVMDEDFSTVLSFMREWFPTLPHEHYILMRSDEVAAGSHISLLTDHNIHAVDFGKTHDELPRFIGRLNPNGDRLVKLRQSINTRIENGLKNILDAQSTASDVNAFLKENLGSPYYWIDSSRLKMLEEALARYNAGINSRKEQFRNYQLIIKGMVTVAELKEKAKLRTVNRRNAAELNNPEFINLALLAYYCLERFPREILEDIRHRRPYAIHSYYFDNYLGKFVREYKLFSELLPNEIKSHYDDDNYFFENLRRIIDSLYSVLLLDPDDVFAPTAPATIVPEISFPCLLLRSRESISIRQIDPPYNPQALLPGEKNMENRFAEFVYFKGRRIIVGYTSQKCFYWNPQNDIASTEFFQAPIKTAIHRVFNYYDGSRLVTEVFCGFRIYHFQDFLCQKEEPLAGNYSSFVRLPESGRVFCVSFNGDGFAGPFLFERVTGAEFTPVLTCLELFQFIKGVPFVQQSAADQAILEDVSAPDKCFLFPFVGDPFIRLATWKGREVLALRFVLRFWKVGGTALMIFDPRKATWVPESIILLPGKGCMAFDLISSEKGIGMICAYMSYNGNLVEYISDIDKYPVIVAEAVSGCVPRDCEEFPVQDMLNLCVISKDDVLVNEEGKNLLAVHIPTMTYQRIPPLTDISSVTHCK